MYEELPEYCYSTLSSGELIIIEKDKEGYHLCDFKGESEELNKLIDVTKAQAGAMEFGSKFGWDTEGANPANYDKEGNLKMIK